MLKKCLFWCSKCKLYNEGISTTTTKYCRCYLLKRISCIPTLVFWAGTANNLCLSDSNLKKRNIQLIWWRRAVQVTDKLCRVEYQCPVTKSLPNYACKSLLLSWGNIHNAKSSLVTVTFGTIIPFWNQARLLIFKLTFCQSFMCLAFATWALGCFIDLLGCSLVTDLMGEQKCCL